MTVVSYPVGRPPEAALRGGDCRGRDLTQDRIVHEGHVFATTTACQFSNGLLRVTVGASGGAPTLTLEALRPAVVVDDVFVDVFVDLFGGAMSTPDWMDVGVLTINSPSVSALLTGVRLMGGPDGVTVRLVAPLMADAFVTLNRGERQVHIQHGSTRPPLVDIDRTVSWADSPSMVGAAFGSRVQEDMAPMPGFFRYVGAIDTATVSAGAFSVTAPSVTTAGFGAGVGTDAPRDRPRNMHQQLGDASRSILVLT